MGPTLVTGGAGFIGAAVARALGGRVITLDALTYAGDASRLDGVPDHRFVHGDETDLGSYRMVL
ncbi:MAG TPA: NAD-dependent epimerase/dehydratase family protein, partial [Myxococcota bacterium]|nr:NAD-dependent epimerase/dehydratase family protein [Myxococcota bacterium]